MRKADQQSLKNDTTVYEKNGIIIVNIEAAKKRFDTINESIAKLEKTCQDGGYEIVKENAYEYYSNNPQPKHKYKPIERKPYKSVKYIHEKNKPVKQITYYK